MKIHRAVIVLITISILLAGRSFSQAERATSRLKKPLIYQIGNVVHINAEGPRPLMRALDALQEKYGWIVDYEDPQYPADSDLATNSASLPSRRHANVRNSGGEGFSVEFKSDPAPDSGPDENSVLTAVVNAYNEGSAVAQFELRRGKERDARFAVVGVGVRRQHNEESSSQPILDLPISLKAERRTAAQTVVVICERVSEQSKITVTPVIADNSRGGRTVSVGGVDVPARTLLRRTLASAGDRLSWRLLYDASSKSYELNLAGRSQ